MSFDLPKANTFPEVAKIQHLVPCTYMRMWSYNESDSIWVLDLEDLGNGFESKSVDTINYKIGFHDIKAGDVYVPDDALPVLYGFMKGWTVECDGMIYTSFREFDSKYYDFDNWIIKNELGEVATKKEKNEIKRIINQSRYTFIESEWCYQYENDWQSFIKDLESKLRCNVYAVPYRISEAERRKLIEYILIYDFRNINGNAWINEILDEIIPEEIAEIEIPLKERKHLFNKTVGDEIRYEVRIRAFYEFLKERKGKISAFIDGYVRNIGLRFCLSSQDNPFITCEAPSKIIDRLDGFQEHIFVATPTMLISTFKTKNTEGFIKDKVKRKEVMRYNKYIAQKSKTIISNRNDIDINRLINLSSLT